MEDWSDWLEWTSSMSSEVTLYSLNRYFGTCICLALVRMPVVLTMTETETCRHGTCRLTGGTGHKQVGIETCQPVISAVEEVTAAWDCCAALDVREGLSVRGTLPHRSEESLG